VKARIALGAALLALAVVAFLVWKVLDRPAPVVEVTRPAQAESPLVPEPPGRPASATSAAAAALPAKPKDATEAPPTIYENLQNRLDAIAKAYVAGDAAAAERAMWPNHAVVRPNGDTLQRSELLGQWMTEWEGFKDRKLSFVIEEVYVEDDQVTAYWTIDLSAKVLGEDGELHDYAVHGLQKAIFQPGRGVDLLDEPIKYHGFEQTWDGMTFKPQ
jgi:hypothetical protein